VLGATPQEFESLILRQEASRPGYGVTKVHSSDEMLDSLRTVVMGPPSKVALSTSPFPTFRQNPAGYFFGGAKDGAAGGLAGCALRWAAALAAAASALVACTASCGVIQASIGPRAARHTLP
jgi:hypothetical protein